MNNLDHWQIYTYHCYFDFLLQPRMKSMQISCKRSDALMQQIDNIMNNKKL